MRSKTAILALIRAAQENSGQEKILTVIRAVLTRWTAHYLAYRRLLELHKILLVVVMNDKLLGRNSRLISGDKKSKARARRMIAVIEDPVFWHALARHVVLQIVANTTDADCLE